MGARGGLAGCIAALKFLSICSDQGADLELRALAGRHRVRISAAPNLVPIIDYWVKDRYGEIIDDSSMSSLPRQPADQNGASASYRTMDFNPYDGATELIVAMAMGKMSLEKRLEECKKAGEAGIPIKKPTRELLGYMQAAATGLDYLNGIHDLGSEVGKKRLTHGDIKPANLLILGNSVAICDYGLVRVSDPTKTGFRGGTPAYIAPELYRGRPDERSDQYCLAVTYMHLRTGKLPFFGDASAEQIIERHETGKLDYSGLGKNEEKVIRRGTSPMSVRRWATCTDMVEQLRTAAKKDEDESWVENLKRVVKAAALSLLLAAVAFGTWKLIKSRGENPDTSQGEYKPNTTGSTIKPIPTGEVARNRGPRPQSPEWFAAQFKNLEADVKTIPQSPESNKPDRDRWIGFWDGRDKLVKLWSDTTGTQDCVNAARIIPRPQRLTKSFVSSATFETILEKLEKNWTSKRSSERACDAVASVRGF